MPRIYDNWERLVEATLDREKLRQLALSESFSSSISADFSSRFSFDSPDVYEASRNQSETSSQESSSSRTVRPIKIEEIKIATRNFRPDMLLGKGVFGCVFKGWIHEYSLTAAKPGSGMAIAVWKLNQYSMLRREEWLAQLNNLCQLHHPNLVKLIGHCSVDSNRRILVYEFMPRGSLENHWFRRGHQSLSWDTRTKVAEGAARALSYLHDMETKLIYRGFRTSDILLDWEFNAKLSIFGLAKDEPTGDIYRDTRAPWAGPEYIDDIDEGHFTETGDVYAFGVVLLELLAGRRSIDRTKSTKEQILVDWAKPYLTDKRKLIRIMDTKLEGQYPKKEAYIIAIIALKCLDRNPDRRPKMSEVLVELEKL